MLKVWIKSLTQDHLDQTIRTDREITTRIVERPGLWMAAADQQALIADMRMVARAALPSGDLHYGVLTGDSDRMANAILTILYDRQSGRPIAFNALSVMEMTLHERPVEVLHMGLVMVDPGARSYGFSWVLYGFTCLILFFRNQMRPLWLSNVTQVPAIVGMVATSFSNVFPSPDPGTRQTFEHLLLARQIMMGHRDVFGVGTDAEFDETRFVIKGAYTGGSDNLKKTYEQAPKHRDQRYNDFCAAELDYERGDDVLQICQLSLATAQRYMLKTVPRRSMPALIAALAFVALNRVVLPVTQWLSADRPWGILRPWRPSPSEAR